MKRPIRKTLGLPLALVCVALLGLSTWLLLGATEEMEPYLKVALWVVATFLSLFVLLDTRGFFSSDIIKHLQQENAALKSELNALMDRQPKLDHEILESLLRELKETPQPEHAIEGEIIGAKMQDFDEETQVNITRQALLEDRLDMLLQPIVSLPQRRIRFFEAYSRLRLKDGTLLIPDNFLGIAERSSFVDLIDNAIFIRCIQLIRKAVTTNPSVRFFINVSVHSLNNRTFLNQFQEFIIANRALLPCLVFEMTPQSFAKLSPRTVTTLELFAKHGLRLSIDCISSLDDHAPYLSSSMVRFLKLDINLVLKELQKDPKARKIHDFRLAAARNDKDVILTHIEDEKQLLTLSEFQFDYGQGFLFGAPATYDVKIQKNA